MSAGKKGAVAFGAGLIFALGLGISGMTQPQKVIGFLNLFGAWDPSLAFVMAGAIAVHLPVSLWVKRQGMFLPVVPCAGDAPAGPEPLASRIDARLLGGSAIFGIGWGLAGYCPGPAVVSVASGGRAALMFAAALVAGTALFRFVTARRALALAARKSFG